MLDVIDRAVNGMTRVFSSFRDVLPFEDARQNAWIVAREAYDCAAPNAAGRDVTPYLMLVIHRDHVSTTKRARSPVSITDHGCSIGEIPRAAPLPDNGASPEKIRTAAFVPELMIDETPETKLAEAERATRVRRACDRLLGYMPAQVSAAVRLLFGLDGDEPLRSEAVAQRLGVPVRMVYRARQHFIMTARIDPEMRALVE